MRQPFLKKQINSARPAALIGLLLIIVLLLSIFALSYLHVKDKRQRDLLLSQIQETRKALDQIHLAMARGDLKKAFTELAQAQKNVDDLYPASRRALSETGYCPEAANGAPSDRRRPRTQNPRSVAGDRPSSAGNHNGETVAGHYSGRSDHCRR
ncbi:MAG: hypothetical protein Q7I89_07400 [Syntrophales bacterium]|nr:hypothetical protein [Syntrophales bacterium]